MTILPFLDLVLLARIVVFYKNVYFLKIYLGSGEMGQQSRVCIAFAEGQSSSPIAMFRGSINAVPGDPMMSM